MTEKLRPSGIDLIGDIPWGTHFCQFYQTREDLAGILIPYLKAGLENNELCLWVTSEPLSGREAEEALREAIPDLDRYLGRGQLEIIPYTDWYLRDGLFDAARVLSGWEERLGQALTRGFDGLRLTGNTLWLGKSGWRDFVAYEEAVDRVISGKRMIALCTYSLDRCSAAEAIEVVKNHQFALARRDGQWERIESSGRRRARETLRETEARHRLLFENMLSGVALCRSELDDRGRPADFVLIEANQAFERHTGMVRDEVIGRRATETMPGVEKDPADWIGVFGRVVTTGEPVRFERFLEPLGRWYSVSAYSPVPDHLVVVFDDISERRSAEEALLRAQEELEMRVLERTGELVELNEALRAEINDHLRTKDALIERSRMLDAFFSHTPDCMVFLDREFNFVRVNEAYARACQRDLSEFPGLNHFDLFPSDELRERFERVVRTKEPYQVFARPFSFPDHPEWGGSFWDLTVAPLLDTGGEVEMLAFSLTDVTVRERAGEELRRAKEELETRVMERTAELLESRDDLEAEIFEHRAKEEQLEKALQEKETLLRELYHRTKNNMNVISGLITLQSAALPDGGALQMFRNLQGRISAMSLVHQKLYQSGDLSNVSLRDYLADLSRAVLDSFGAAAGRVALNLDIESFTLSIDTIMPCGLVINELISNSMKYAFPGDRSGEITIEARLTAEEEVRIRYSDNGVGLPEGVGLMNTKTLGMKLIKRLTEGQLGGRVELGANGGAEFFITFREPHYTRRI